MANDYKSLHPSDVSPISRVWYKEQGSYNCPVPTGAFWVRAFALGCGGQGQNWGGGGALAGSRRSVTPGENLKIQVGRVGTESTQGDSFVMRNDGVTALCYADRGRGGTNSAGAGGLAANSQGDVTFDGTAGWGAAGVTNATAGIPASDAGRYANFGFGGRAIYKGSTADVYSSTVSNGLGSCSDYGGGGHVFYATNENGNLIMPAAFCAGTGLVVLEFFATDPGYV